VHASFRTDLAGTRRSIRAALRGRPRAMEQAVNARRERSEPLHPGWRAVRHAPCPPDRSRTVRKSGYNGAMKIYDVTLDLKPGIPVYPKNPEFRFEAVSRIAQGASSNGSLVTMGTHTGTHVDAPFHIYDGQGGVETLPLDALVGPARVIRVDVTDRHVEARDLEPLEWGGVERVLIRTRNSDRWAAATAFDASFTGLAGDAAQFLAARKV